MDEQCICQTMMKWDRVNHLRDSYRIMWQPKLYLGEDYSGVLIRNQSPAVERIFRETR